MAIDQQVWIHGMDQQVSVLEELLGSAMFLCPYSSSWGQTEAVTALVSTQTPQPGVMDRAGEHGQ